MTNKVERELCRLCYDLSEKYDFEQFFKEFDLKTLGRIGFPDDVAEALNYWFDVRIRKTDPADGPIKRTSSDSIKSALIEDLGIKLPHEIIGAIMVDRIGKDNVITGGGPNPFDVRFMFSNVEIIPLEEYAIMKIFIAQPMSGVPDEEVEKIRVHVSELMIKKFGKNIEIVDQFHVPEEEMPKESLERPGIHLLGRSIQFLADVDLVVFVGDFLHAKGCCVELAVCKEYDIPFEVYNISDIDKRDNSNDWLY